MPEIKICEKCGLKNQASNNFCEQCGSKLPALGQQEKGLNKQSASSKTQKPSQESEAKEFREKIPVNNSPLPAKTSFSFSWMEIAYAILLLITVFTRFDHLGDKPHHHDESMHSFYSYQLFKDGDYEYNPMMHGPFQFHGNAFMYYLFGVSNATSRYLAATFGILTVVLAMFLAPFLGRWGSFLATAMIVFSPSFMYFDRFTREDAYIAGATFLMVVFMFRYYRSRQPMDLWLAALGFTIAFCTKESIFLTVAVIGTYLFIRLLPWLDVLIAGGLTVFGVLMMVVIDKGSPARMPVFMLLLGSAFLYTLFQLFTRWQENMKKSKAESTLWEIVCGFGFEKISWEILAYIGWWVMALLILRVCPHFGVTVPMPFSFLMLLAYLGLVFWFCWLWLNNVAPALTGSLAIGSIIFTLLFTTFFTVGASQPDFWSRIHGLFNALYMGAFGGLEYWWEQHDVHRGDQPWYYYLVQLPANELLSFLFSFVAMLYYGLFKRKNFPLFLAYWYLGSLALFSWAGEKMPWLILHPLLPALLLSAYFMGQILESRPVEHFWKSARIAAMVAFGLLLSYSFHSAILLSFYHEANPVEPLVYVQSGPDCKEVERIVRQISYGETGGPNPEAPAGITDAEKGLHDGLALTIEDKCSWPFAWFLRDFSRRNHPANITAADNPIIMTATESDAQAYPILSQAGYVNRKYELRIWWVPSWFKKGYPSTDINSGLFFSWLFSNFIPLSPARPDMVDWTDLKNWFLYRQVWSDLGSYNMRLWVRKDLADKYGFTETNRQDIPADYPTPVPTPEPTPISKHKHSHS
jgi:predicted membrane-bound mannosyltransferase